MNIQDILHFILSHSEMLIGITIGLALITVIVILVLPSQDSQMNAIDLRGIEEALRRAVDKNSNFQPAPALAAVPTSGIQDDEEHGHHEAHAPEASGAAPPVRTESATSANSGSAAPSNASAPQSSIDPVIIEKLKNEVSERERKIKDLESELSRSKTSGPKANDNDEAHQDALAKIQELQSKLSEYAIIEEELADISKFKEENARLKEQLSAASNNVSNMNVATEIPGAASPAVEQVAAPEEEVIEGLAMQPPPMPPPKRQAEDIVSQAPATSAASALSSEDQVVLDFQAAVENQALPKAALAKDVWNSLPIQPVSAQVSEPVAAVEPVAASSSVVATSPLEDSPLDGSLDTSKMLQEIEKLGDESEGEVEDPMAGLLDTEKLLAEVKELGGSKDASINSDQAAVDDLMSEFEAEQEQIKAKA